MREGRIWRALPDTLVVSGWQFECFPDCLGWQSFWGRSNGRKTGD